MWREFSVAIVAFAVFGSVAAAQGASSSELRGVLRSPSWAEAPTMRVYGLDVSAAATDRGMQLGFDRRFGGWSMGLKGDWASSQNCIRFAPLGPDTSCSAFNWQSTAAGRIAYAWDRLLAYTQGGAVFSQWDRAALSDSQSGFDAAKSISKGWVLGGGLEYALGSAWSLRAEYNYFDYGRPDSGSAAAINNLGDSYDVRNHMLMFGLKHRM